MSIIEKAVEKLANEPIQPNRIAKKKDSENVSTVFGAVVAEADRLSGNRFISVDERIDDEVLSDADVDAAPAEEVEIDLKRLRKAQIALVDEDSPRLNEELRMIKRRLLVNAAGLGESSLERGNLIMVTSSVPNEGKTFIATNLALSIAREIDRTVLLVDADIAKSDVTKTFGLNGKPGLTDYLNGEAKLRDVLLKTNISGLTILPTGKKVSNATELMSSNRMQTLANELADRYKDRIIIFDSPPMLVTSEAPVLASMVGQVAFVVKAEETKQKEFVTAIERLDHSKYVGLILNQSDEEGESGYYGYYHSN